MFLTCIGAGPAWATVLTTGRRVRVEKDMAQRDGGVRVGELGSNVDISRLPSPRRRPRARTNEPARALALAAQTNHPTATQPQPTS